MTSWILLPGVALSALLFYLFYFFQRRFVFSPQFYPNRSLINQHSDGYRLFRLNVAKEVEIEGIVYEPDHARLTALFFGGKGQDSVSLVRKLSVEYPAVRWVAFNYRGYGTSQGFATEKHVLHDALVAYDWVSTRYKDTCLMGFSLGSSVASYVASHRRPGWTVLVAPFDSVRSLIHEKAYFIPNALILFGFETIKFVDTITSPVYVYYSIDDEIVPPWHVQTLLKHVGSLAGTKGFRGFKHAEILFSDALKKEFEKVISS